MTLVDSIRGSESESLEIPAHFPSDLRNIVKSLLMIQPQKRITIEQFLRSPIIVRELEKMIADFIPLTFDYKTSRFGHTLLEKIIQKRCEQSMIT